MACRLRSGPRRRAGASACTLAAACLPAAAPSGPRRRAGASACHKVKKLPRPLGDGISRGRRGPHACVTKTPSGSEIAGSRQRSTRNGAWIRRKTFLFSGRIRSVSENWVRMIWLEKRRISAGNFLTQRCSVMAFSSQSARSFESAKLTVFAFTFVDRMKPLPGCPARRRWIGPPLRYPLPGSSWRRAAWRASSSAKRGGAGRTGGITVIFSPKNRVPLSLGRLFTAWSQSPSLFPPNAGPVRPVGHSNQTRGRPQRYEGGVFADGCIQAHATKGGVGDFTPRIPTVYRNLCRDCGFCRAAIPAREFLATAPDRPVLKNESVKYAPCWEIPRGSRVAASAGRRLKCPRPSQTPRTHPSPRHPANRPRPPCARRS
ncbi:MAG: hypothetical protein RL077_3593 [Verrucomicrobiota bacterium]